MELFDINSIMKMSPLAHILLITSLLSPSLSLPPIYGPISTDLPATPNLIETSTDGHRLLITFDPGTSPRMY